MNQAYATAVVLLVLVVIINLVSSKLAGKISKAEPAERINSVQQKEKEDLQR